MACLAQAAVLILMIAGTDLGGADSVASIKSAGKRGQEIRYAQSNAAELKCKASAARRALKR
jgi:hypothetical protein